MISASSKSSSIVYRHTLDEVNFKLSLSGRYKTTEKLKIFILSVLKEMKLKETIIIDRNDETKIAIRLPYPGIILENDNMGGQASLQMAFKGFFFSNGEAEEEQIATMKIFVKKFCSALNTFPVLSGVDIAVDTNGIDQSDFMPDKMQYGFRGKVVTPQYDIQGDDWESLYIKNRDFVINVYNKKKEIKDSKNEIKKAYYEAYFGENCEQITRVETRLKSRLARVYTQAMLETTSFATLAQTMMKDFATKRRMYIKKPQKKINRKNQARDLEEFPFWAELRTAELRPVVKNIGLKLGTSKFDFKTITQSIINQNLKRPEEMTKTQMIQWIERNWLDIEETTKMKKLELEQFREEVQKLKSVITDI